MSKTNIPCDTVKDLFPSYIDHLTSETTNRLIEEHIADCAGCSETLKTMRTPETGASEAVQAKEIDFLKKNKKRNLKIIIGSIAGAFLLVCVILMIKVFVIGDSDYAGIIATRVTVSGSDITLTAVPVDSAHAISDLTVEEKDGIVTVRTRTVLTSFLHRGDYRTEYTAKQAVRQVRLNGRILWDDGTEISALTSEVYETRHDYMGSAPDNMRTAYALSMRRYLGDFQNELKTSERPYVWRILLTDEYSERERTVRESDMDSFAYVLLGVIGNLDEVEYVYSVGGESFTRTVTAEDAAAFFGRSVKDCGRSPRLLNALLDKTGLSDLAAGSATADTGENRNVTLNLVNFTENEIQAVGISVYSNGSLINSGGICNADNSTIKKGESIIIGLERSDLGNGDDITVVLSIETPDGKSYDVTDSIRIPSQEGAESTVKLYGSVREGFTLVQ